MCNICGADAPDRAYRWWSVCFHHSGLRSKCEVSWRWLVPFYVIPAI